MRPRIRHPGVEGPPDKVSLGEWLTSMAPTLVVVGVFVFLIVFSPRWRLKKYWKAYEALHEPRVMTFGRDGILFECRFGRNLLKWTAPPPYFASQHVSLI